MCYHIRAPFYICLKLQYPIVGLFYIGILVGEKHQQGRKKRNFAFLKVRKKKIGVIAMAKEQTIRDKVPSYNISPLSEGVQGFYNGECARIDVTNDSNLTEVIDLLTEIQK